MALIPNLTDFSLYMKTPLDDDDWENNMQQIVDYFIDNDYSWKIDTLKSNGIIEGLKDLTVEGDVLSDATSPGCDNLNIGGNLTLADLTGTSFIDGTNFSAESVDTATLTERSARPINIKRNIQIWTATSEISLSGAYQIITGSELEITILTNGIMATVNMGSFNWESHPSYRLNLDDGTEYVYLGKAPMWAQGLNITHCFQDLEPGIHTVSIEVEPNLGTQWKIIPDTDDYYNGWASFILEEVNF